MKGRGGAWRRGRAPSFWPSALGIAAALAALSLLVPFEPVFDAWAWLIWGREITGGELDTSAGASWKPGPVLLTTPASLLGDAAAPQVWLFAARFGWLLGPLIAGRLAWRLARRCGAGGPAALAAGGIAAVALVLLYDGFTPWIRQFAGGLSEPLLVAILLGAIEAHLAGSRRAALALLVGASLFRPEAWPLLAGYGWLLWRHDERSLRPWLIAGAVAVPVLWFVPDLIGSGSATSGAGRAAVADDEGAVTNGLEALWRAFGLAPVALVVATVCVVALPGRLGADPRGERTLLRLSGLAAAWVVIVFAMALVGFAGLPRFSAPAGALVCVVGAVGLVLLAGAARRSRPALVAVAALAALLVAQGGWRAAELAEGAGDAATIAEEIEGMRDLVDRLGAERFAECGPLSTSDLDSQPPLAWELERPVSGVSLRRSSVPAEGIAVIGPGAQSEARDAAAALPERVPVTKAGEWSAYEISCSGRRSATGEPPR